jgi:hypothetical protein
VLKSFLSDEGLSTLLGEAQRAVDAGLAHETALHHDILLRLAPDSPHRALPEQADDKGDNVGRVRTLGEDDWTE